MTHRLQSRRTDLQPFSSDDAEALLSLFRDALVRRYLLDDALVSEEWVRDEIATSKARFEASGAGLWCVRRTGDEHVIGFAGFREFFEPPRLQLLYGLHPDTWGEGLATEVAETICRHAFLTLDFERIEAATDVPNHRSVRVLERLGMHLERRSDEGDAGTLFYVLDRAAWANTGEGNAASSRPGG